MAKIKIWVINLQETEKVKMRVPNNVAVGELIDAIIDSMELPLRRQDGCPLVYHLAGRDHDSNLERLRANRTLEANHIQDGDTLQLVEEMLRDEPPSEGITAVLEKLHSLEERVGKIENKLAEVAGAFDAISRTL